MSIGAIVIVVFFAFLATFIQRYFYFLNGKIRMKPTVPVQISMGTMSGLMGGLFGMQGPPAVLYFISCTDRKEEYMALTQLYFIVGNIFIGVAGIVALFA